MYPLTHGTPKRRGLLGSGCIIRVVRNRKGITRGGVVGEGSQGSLTARGNLSQL